MTDVTKVDEGIQSLGDAFLTYAHKASYEEVYSINLHSNQIRTLQERDVLCNFTRLTLLDISSNLVKA